MRCSRSRNPIRFALCGAAVVACALGAGPAPSAAAADWKAGAAKVKITPARHMWMSGYASRKGPAEGTAIDLWAKALVIEDPHGSRGLLITLDLVGIDRDLAGAVCEAIRKKHHLERRQIAICCSHTHSGPVVGRTLLSMYFLDDVQRQLVADYTIELERQMEQLVDQAFAQLAPARLAWANGHSSIAVNRRTNAEADVHKLRAAGQLKGPVDHDLPVLAVRSLEGKLTAVVFGYACHATVLDLMQWSGDYPGYAQLEVEKQHPEAVALFFAGCGGDQNPLPRRKTSIAEIYGKSLAESVDTVLDGAMHAVEGELATSYAELPLPFSTLPTRDELVSQSKSVDRYVAQRARILLEQVDAGRPLQPTYPYPIQLWRLGKDLNWLSLGGEVTVDYSIRLKRELGRDHTWVAAYTNDVMAYIPSQRVLKEGGYEGASSMIYYGLPTTWSPELEETIIKGVHELVKPR